MTISNVKGSEQLPAVQPMPDQGKDGKRYPLTARQLFFCRNVLKGMTLTDAYLNAYPASRSWKRSTVWAEASRLASSRKVVAWLTLKREEEDQRLQAAQLRLRMFVVTNLEREAILGDTTAGRVRALELLGRIPQVGLFTDETIKTENLETHAQLEARIHSRLVELLEKVKEREA